MNRKTIIVFSKMSDKLLIRLLKPISESDIIENIILVRNKPLNLNKVINYNPPKVLNSNILFTEIYRFFISFLIFIKYNIDAVLGIQMIYHGYFAFIFSHLFSKPFVFYLVEFENKIFDSKLSKLSTYILSKANIIITGGNNSVKNLKPVVNASCKIIAIPIFMEFPDKTKYNYEKIYDLLYLGTFTPSKRMDILIESVNMAVKDFNMNLKVVMRGDGPLKKDSMSLVEKYNLNNNIEFIGWLDDPYQLMANCKVFIMTSEYDGLPMSMKEALSLGIPCILPNISNIPEVAIHGYNSLLIENLDVEGYANAINKLLTNNDLYLKLQKGAENFFQEHEYEYSLENATNNWNLVLEKLVVSTHH